MMMVNVNLSDSNIFIVKPGKQIDLENKRFINKQRVYSVNLSFFQSTSVY